MNIAIIPARGGSQRIPRKNVKLFRGVSMLWYPIHAAKMARCFQLVVVSTDDDEIEAHALKYGAVVVRRPNDDGTRGTQEIARDVLRQINADFACVIYPCSPLLYPHDLLRGMSGLAGHDFAMSVDQHGNDAGCFYWGKGYAFTDRLPLDTRRTARVRLPPERCCDINTPEDWAKAEALYDALRSAA